jgi:hypothetical protein
MPAVEIYVVDAKALSEAMAGMREWLDHRGCKPSTFRHTIDMAGVLCRVDFENNAEAAEFAQAFGGEVISQRTGAVASMP